MAQRLPNVCGDFPLERGHTLEQTRAPALEELKLDLHRYVLQWAARHEHLNRDAQTSFGPKPKVDMNTPRNLWEGTAEEDSEPFTPVTMQPLMGAFQEAVLETAGETVEECNGCRGSHGGRAPASATIPLPLKIRHSSSSAISVFDPAKTYMQTSSRESVSSTRDISAFENNHGFSPHKRNLVSALYHANSTFQQQINLQMQDQAPTNVYLAAMVRLDRSGVYQKFCSLMIMANAFCLACTTELVIERPGDENYDLFLNLERAFCCFYLMELAIRAGAQRKQFFVGSDAGWNLFDAMLAMSAAQEQLMTFLSSSDGASQNYSYLRIVRLLKLVKLLRVIRLLRTFRELRLVMNSILGSMKALLWSFLLIAGICFMFGVCFVQAVNEFAHVHLDGAVCADKNVTAWTDDLNNLDTWVDMQYDVAARAACYYWGSIGVSMLSLFQASTGGYDWEVLARPLLMVGGLYYSILCFYIGFFLFVVMNSLTSLFLDSVMTNAQLDEDQIMQDQLARKQEYMAKVVDIFCSIDDDGSGQITYEEFIRAKHKPMLVAFANSLDIEPNALHQFFAILSGGGTRTVDLETFVVGCIKVRGTARSMDLMDVLITQEHMADDQTRFMHFCEEQFFYIQQALLSYSRNGAAWMKTTRPCSREK